MVIRISLTHNYLWLTDYKVICTGIHGQFFKSSLVHIIKTNKQVANARFREQNSLLSHQVWRLLFLTQFLNLGQRLRAQIPLRKDLATTPQVYTANPAPGCFQRALEPFTKVMVT